jgi:hypothetical protein
MSPVGAIGLPAAGLCTFPSKSKDERGVGYVKCNAIACYHFPSWTELEAHLAPASGRWSASGATRHLLRAVRDRAASCSGSCPARLLLALLAGVLLLSAVASMDAASWERPLRAALDGQRKASLKAWTRPGHQQTGRR